MGSASCVGGGSAGGLAERNNRNQTKREPKSKQICSVSECPLWEKSACLYKRKFPGNTVDALNLNKMNYWYILFFNEMMQQS
jgi:hypothetical protein